jgi:hypothetical protein
MDKTSEAVHRQISAMGCDVFEVGLYKPDAQDGVPVMLLRTWDSDALLSSIGWLRKENRDGRNIYVRPSGEHNLSLVDDLTRDAVSAMKRSGFSPAIVVETSPSNYQAWLKHPDALDRGLSTATARALAEKFGGDRGAADWRHFGRLAGFTNRKQKYQNITTGLFPFVRLIEADGRVYEAVPRFLSGVKQALEEFRREHQRMRTRLDCTRQAQRLGLKSIDAFRSNPRYAGDGTRIDLTYAIYALSHGVSEGEVTTAIQSRDLPHKGNQQRQADYVDRTLRKAFAALEIAERGR